VTFNYFNSGDYKGIFFEQYFAAYHEAHPNITIEYQGISGAESAKIVPLGIQNGNAPDCFQSIANISGAQMVEEGWVRPLDDIVPDFETWKQNFPESALVEGISVFDGKLYALPYVSNKQYATLLYYNTEYMEKAGFDPASKPLTWEEFREAAKKITEQGHGQYFGYIIAGEQTGRLGQIVNNLAEIAGAHGGDIDWTTGEYQFTSDAFIAAIELLLAMQSDGSIFPGSISLNAPQTRSQFPQGAAGMIMQGTWNIPQWIAEAPDFGFQVASAPVADGVETPLLSYGPGPFIPMWVNADTKYPEIAGDMFHYLGSEEGQRQFATITNGSDRPMLDSAIESAELDDRVRAAYGIFDEQLRVAPSPAVRNPDVELVFRAQKRLSPNLGELIQGLLAGQISDVKAAMQDLQDRSEAGLDAAIAEAKDKGAEVSRDDWVFPNWDPARDYTQEDYDALN
jgi:multiple sugar transport system substrate-binding protein